MRRALLAALLVWPAALASAAAAPQPPPRRTPSRTAKPPDTASAAPKVDVAFGAYQRGLYLTAYREAMARVERDPGDAAAMTLIGELVNQGLAVRQDVKAAAGWYRLAAARGDAHAMTTLGLMTIDGRGVARDREAGRVWLERAAALGEPTASYDMALVLLARGSQSDIARAAKLLRVAAEAEIGDAQHALGVLYSKGQGGLAQDAAKAAQYYFRAARNGSLAGEVEYAIAEFNGDGLPRDEEAGARRFRHAGARGNAIAQNRLARLYATGRGVPRNLVEAAAWHLMASAQGLSDAWLDEAVSDLNSAQRKLAEQLAAARTGRS